MKPKSAVFAVWRVSYGPSSSSVFMLPKKLSIGALSQQSPLRLIEHSMPCSSSRRRYAWAAYWLPRSEWCSNPLPGWRLVIAMRSAATVSSCGMVSDIAQPTTLRREHVQDDCQIQPALEGRHIGDVGQPDLG